MHEGFRFSWRLGRLPDHRTAEQTVAAIRRFAVQDSRTPEIRLLALGLVRDELSYDRRGEVEAIQRFVRDEIRYVRDVLGAETVQSPRFTLRVGQGDCDDKSGLVASLLYSIGYPVRYVLAATDSRHPGQYTHVYPETLVGGRWVAVETIVPGAPLGFVVAQHGAPKRIA